VGGGFVYNLATKLPTLKDYLLYLANNMFMTKCKAEKSTPSPESRTQYMIVLGIYCRELGYTKP
jgi:hypothetical protein